jgi:mono/diheme cytochrome c family protein
MVRPNRCGIDLEGPVIPWMSLLSTPALAGAEEGRPIYVAKCQACHGAEGKGDGPAARALPKKPKDLSSPAFWTSMSDDQVRAAITSGLPGTIMREFPMPPAQLNDLMAYLKSFVVTTQK